MSTRTFSLIVILVAFGTGCSSPMAPASGTHAGDWTGTTSQGTSISFTVSSTERVTAITVGYDFSGCSGTKTFGFLDVAINTAPRELVGLLPPGTEQFAGFNFRDGAQSAPNATQVVGVLKSETAASGAVSFENYADCPDGSEGATWNATKAP
jgi:hypothetical protein